MPKETLVRKARRRARRSLPSSIERNLSLEELIGNADDRQTRRQKQEAMAQAKLQLMNAYFSMIDETQLKVESETCLSQPIREDTNENAPCSSPRAVSDSEMTACTIRCKTKRTVRRRNLMDTQLQAEYDIYCEATSGVITPLSIAEFAATIEPNAKTGMYEGILDVNPEETA